MITHGYNLSNKINIELNIHILQTHHLKNDDEEIIIPSNVIPIKNMNKMVEMKKLLFGKLQFWKQEAAMFIEINV